MIICIKFCYQLDKTFELFLAFCQCKDDEVLLKAFTGIGIIIRNLYSYTNRDLFNDFFQL